MGHRYERSVLQSAVARFLLVTSDALPMSVLPMSGRVSVRMQLPKEAEPALATFQLYISNDLFHPVPACPVISARIENVAADVVGVTDAPVPVTFNAPPGWTVHVESAAGEAPLSSIVGVASHPPLDVMWDPQLIDTLTSAAPYTPKATRAPLIIVGQGPTAFSFWEPTAWSVCSVSCGIGEQNRALQCMVRPGQWAPNPDWCTGLPLPEVRRACEMPGCLSGFMAGCNRPAILQVHSERLFRRM